MMIISTSLRAPESVTTLDDLDTFASVCRMETDLCTLLEETRRDIDRAMNRRDEVEDGTVVRWKRECEGLEEGLTDADTT